MTHKACSRRMFLVASSSFEQPVFWGRSVDKESVFVNTLT